MSKKLTTIRLHKTAKLSGMKDFDDEIYFKKVYLLLMNSIRKLEGAFSNLIFLLFVNSFLEILRIETVVLMYMKGHWQLDVFVHSLYYSIIAAVSFLAIIISADQAQDNIFHAKESLRGFNKVFLSVQYRLKELKEEIECWHDMRHIRLTAWGMFKVKRDLFLSIIALYISYGMLIVQFTP
ncbi:hypothetical protein AVEN_29120-1 [Araneus ventricosus]|uniref:Uncharacterized protein n=1 Tax=Araneus ventricosus TaxID=182803 RepID=A0A4Y2AK42_ARAVE|nr:hypothetical protein AVEN_29120-1 [Araneus ventricosus]